MRPVTFLADNEVTLLRCGTDYFPALIEAIEAAQYEIYFETYIFAGDETGQRVQAALMAAAQRGVMVRMITDWFGTGNARIKAMHAQLLEAKVEHRVFNAWFRRGVTRTHRKICVVDRQVAFVGGININDDMFCDYDHNVALSAPRWDFAVAVRGPLVAAIEQEAQAQWARLGKMGLFKRIGLYRDLRKVNKIAAQSTVQAGFVVRDNLRNRVAIQRAYLQALGKARKSVLLIGVGEIWLQDAVAHSFYPKLLAAGVKVVEYHKTQLHAKVAVIDDDWATVGSSNVDGLSLFLNQEANVVIKDAAFAQSLRTQIELAIADGVVVHLEDFKHVGRFRRIGYEIAFVCYKLLMRVFAVGKYA